MGDTVDNYVLNAVRVTNALQAPKKKIATPCDSKTLLDTPLQRCWVTDMPKQDCKQHVSGYEIYCNIRAREMRIQSSGDEGSVSCVHSDSSV